MIVRLNFNQNNVKSSWQKHFIELYQCFKLKLDLLISIQTLFFRFPSQSILSVIPSCLWPKPNFLAVFYWIWQSLSNLCINTVHLITALDAATLWLFSSVWFSRRTKKTTSSRSAGSRSRLRLRLIETSRQASAHTRPTRMRHQGNSMTFVVSS